MPEHALWVSFGDAHNVFTLLWVKQVTVGCGTGSQLLFHRQANSVYKLDRFGRGHWQLWLGRRIRR